MKNLKLQLLFSILIFTSFISRAQIIGGRDNSQASPKVAEASKLNGGSYTGDVNNMTGAFQSSINLGSVATPGGLGFSLNLSHSSSFSFSTNQPTASGIPYGDGWNLSLPTISVETDIFHAFGTQSECDDNGPSNHNTNKIENPDKLYEGDVFWFSPTINIPGVGGGSAVFKYVDDDDAGCAVFVLNTFESPMEIRFYGNNWTVSTADGTVYVFESGMTSYRAPSNKRFIDYKELDVTSLSSAGGDELVNVPNTFPYGPSLQNVIEPKMDFGLWYCSRIYNPNLPGQNIIFTYEKFGEFDFFQEFSQENYSLVHSDIIDDVSQNFHYTPSFKCYKDILLKKVESWVVDGTPLDILELEYRSLRGSDYNANGTILDPYDIGHTRLDSLYTSKVVSNNSINPFNQWVKYAHANQLGNNQTGINSSNPYVDLSGNYHPSYNNSSTINFDHSILESPRLMEGGIQGIGDVYEIRTKIVGSTGISDLKNGNGTVDIALVTARNATTVASGVALAPTTQTNFNDSRGTKLFSTFNSAMKWTRGNVDGLYTSNFFVMPNLPSDFKGFNIQVGPGNSEIDYAYNDHLLLNAVYTTNPPTITIDDNNALAAYPQLTAQGIKSSATIPQNFGIGLPWGMMAPVFNTMSLANVNPLPDFELLYINTWSAPLLVGGGISPKHNPTKLSNTVELEEFELIRYSKNAYMLQGVKQYRVNGETNDNITTGKILVTQKQLKYTNKNLKGIKNKAYEQGVTIEIDNNFNRVIFLLSQIDEVPLDGELFTPNYGLTNTDEILSTSLEYENILPSGSMTYDGAKPYQGLTHYALTKYIDQLGGETSITYYLITAPETRLVSNFLLPQTCFGSNTNRPYGTDKTFTAHLAVQYIQKKVDNYNLNTGQYWSPIRKMEYVYDLTKKIYNRQQFEVPANNFRGTYSHKYDLAFGKTTVYTPAIDGGARNHTVYEYYGEQIGSFSWGHNVSEANYILYGKPKSVKSYDHNGLIHQETIYNYDYTLAAIDGYDRPNFVRNGISLYDHLVFRDYEYKDFYKEEELTVQFDANTFLTGDAAKIAAVPNSFAQPFFKIDRPKYLPFYFHNLLRQATTINDQDGGVTTTTQVNPDYLFNSYFVKKTSEINRTYENGLATELSPLNPGLPTSIIIGNNPDGTMPLNSVNYSQMPDALKLNKISTRGNDYVAELRSLLPVSDTVLKAVIAARNITEPNKHLILKDQSGLSPIVWKYLIDNHKNFSSNSLSDLTSIQGYFDDEIQHYIISKTGPNSFPGARTQLGSEFLEDILLLNAVLSDSVILDLALSPNTMPGISYKNILETQTRQLSQSVITSMIESVNCNSRNAVDILKNQGLDDNSYKALIDNSGVDSWTIVNVIDASQFDPSDSIIYYYINERNPSAEQVQIIVDKVDREFGEFLKIRMNLIYVNPIIVIQNNVNPLAVNCGNTVHTNRIYIETVKEFEYYEANYKGQAVGKAYELLMGHISSVDEPSSFPKNFSDYGGLGFSKTLNKLQLKHEPSWQVFSVTTKSPHLPGAKSREEYFYLYDLQNKYDRVWYNFDLDNSLSADVYDIGNPYPYDTFVVNMNWDVFYEVGSVPSIPEFDGMYRTRQYKNKSLAFQKTSFSKNVTDTKMIRRSEYYDYDSRWRYDDLKVYAQTIPLIGDPCPPIVDPCEECDLYNHVFDQNYIDMYLPEGWCAYQTELQNVGHPFYYWFCPANVDITLCDPNANSVASYCKVDPGNNNGSSGLPIAATALTKSLQLRSVSIEVDSLDFSTLQEFDTYKMDPKNKYIAEFELGDPTDMDENQFAGEYKMILPFTNLEVRTIDERNRHFQPELEHNQVNLKTKYYYDRAVAQFYQNPDCPTDNYFTNINTNIGLPNRITVGYLLPDSLSTAYEYSDAGMVSKVTEPSGKFTEYTFDNFNRLSETKQNGVRILSNYSYNYWDDNVNDNFFEKTEKNYVSSTIYNSNNLNDSESRRAYMDPVGRTQGIISSYVTGNTINHIYSGSAIYDNWDRVIQSHKNYVVTDDLTQNPSAITPIASTGYLEPYSNTYYENNPKSRAIRSSNYGVDITDPSDHVVRSTFDITNNIYASCELGLNKTELYQVMSSGTTQSFRFFRVKMLDQDNKESIEYTNAMGQKVGTIKKNGSEEIVTLFIYDSYGNLSKVINPSKQENTYTFNVLGQLVVEKTPDAGERKYMYNKQGLVSVSLDQQGWKNQVSSVASPFYRVFDYDIYGRLNAVGRSNGPTNYNNYTEFGPLHYKSTALNTAQVFPDYQQLPSFTYFDYTYTNASSQDWLASYKSYETLGDPGNYFESQVSITSLLNKFQVFAVEKETQYGDNSNLSTIGKVTQTNSYNNLGAVVQRTNYLYDNYDNLSNQRVYFNANQQFGAEVFPQVSNISYPSYNYRGALLEEIVDVDISDGIDDIHYFYTYDPLNRLTQVAAAGGVVSSVDDATVLVSYYHDDANGLVKKKTHSIDENGLSEDIVDINYYYDIRDRLTDVSAQELHGSTNPQMMSYKLFYDDQNPYYNFGQSSTLNASHNWNGNINGSLMEYEFNCQNCPTSSFQDPLLYGYSYDNLNRLTRADAMVGDYLINTAGDEQIIYDSYAVGDVTIDYDKIGNISYLSRGLKSHTNGVMIDLEEFNYNYQSGKNQLNSVSNINATRNYTYDFNGNLLTDSYRTINSTQYGRAAYAFEIVQSQAAISYLYSIDDQRMFKKVINSTETKEEYYLSDAMGKVVALKSKVIPTVGTTTTNWEYYVHGAEREARLVNTDNDVRFGVDEVNFFIYDHLGNTRVNYSPVITEILASTSNIVDDQFVGTSTNGWSAFNANTVVSNTSGALMVNNTTNTPICIKPILINHATYSVEIEVQFDINDIPTMSLSVGSDVFALTNGTNIFTTQQTGYGLIDAKVIANSGTGTFTMKYFKVDEVIPAHSEFSYAVNYAADYFPYGKVLREYTNSNGQERYLTTQHERDKETGLDYRGARYYDSDVGRFLSLDPLAKKFPSWSAYNYVFARPIILIDPNGKAPKETGWTENHVRLNETFGDANGFNSLIQQQITKVTDYSYNKLEKNYNKDGQAIVSNNSTLNYLKGENTCAIKLSHTLNKSGYSIPRSQDTPKNVRIQNTPSGNYVLDAKSMVNYLKGIQAPTYYFENLNSAAKIEEAIQAIHASDDMVGIIGIVAGDSKAYGATGHVDLLYEDFMWDLSFYGYNNGMDVEPYLQDRVKINFTIYVWVLGQD